MVYRRRKTASRMPSSKKDLLRKANTRKSRRETVSFSFKKKVLYNLAYSSLYFRNAGIERRYFVTSNIEESCGNFLEMMSKIF